MKNPCYDPKTKTDCKDRCTGCSTICALWHQYEKERNELYKERAKNAIQAGADITAQHRLQKRIDGYKPRTRRK